MNTLLKSILSLLLIHISCASSQVAPASVVFSKAATNSGQCETADPRQCTKNCLSVLICDSDRNIVSQLNCPEAYPYCESGRCQEELPTTCSNAVPGVCPGKNGYYPDATSCYKYYYCDNDQKATVSYECPPGFPYDMDQNKCVRGRPCSVINCNNRLYATNPAYPRLGALCSNNKIIDGTYEACPVGYEIDATYACSPKCRKTGTFADAYDSTKAHYYRCLPSGPYGTLVLTRQKCPTTFNPDKLECNKVTDTGRNPGSETTPISSKK